MTFPVSINPLPLITLARNVKIMINKKCIMLKIFMFNVFSVDKSERQLHLRLSVALVMNQQYLCPTIYPNVARWSSWETATDSTWKSSIRLNVIYDNSLHNPLADPRGREGCPPPFLVQFLSFACSLRGKFGHIIVWRPPPPHPCLGNPGCATVVRGRDKRISEETSQ